MKKILTLSLLITLIRASVLAYDFKVDGIRYNIISSVNLTVEVSCEKLYAINNYYYCCNYEGDIVIPEKVQFENKTYTVIGIGNWAFGCDLNVRDYSWAFSLKTVTLPESITYIGEYAFSYCRSLKTINLPKSLKKIGYMAFSNCGSILSMIIPSNVSSIGTLPPNLKELILLSYLPPVNNGIGIMNTIDILVPFKDKYLEDPGWATYNIVEMLTPSSREFPYTGQSPTITWTNNLPAYSMSVSNVILQKNAGSYSSIVEAGFFCDNDLIFKLEFPYEYTINKAIIKAKAMDVIREYGDENPLFKVTYTGFINGENESVILTEPSASTIADRYINVGQYPINLNGGEAENYGFEYESGILSVTKASISAKVKDTKKVYGSHNPAFTIEYYGLKNNETTPIWTTVPTFQTDATQSSGVGQYEVKALNGMPVNYDLGEITAGTLNITPAPLTIKANDATRQYYADEPNFGYTCNGFVNGENENVLSPAPTLATSANKYSSVGTYPIKASGASNPNYSISYVDGTLSITPRTLMALVGNYERPYNEENPSFEIKYDGFMGDDNETSLVTKPKAQTTAIKTSDVGTYPISVIGGEADNYEFSYTGGVLTINKAEQTIAWEQELSNLQVGDQVELTAIATSGLPITYTCNNESVAEIYSANNKTYLDCRAVGEVSLRAVQNGNHNYYSSPRVSKTATIGDNKTAIEQVNGNSLKIQRMSDGIRVTGLQQGDIIQVYSMDGLLLKSIKAERLTTDIPLTRGHLYIVRVGERSIKVALK